MRRFRPYRRVRIAVMVAAMGVGVCPKAMAQVVLPAWERVWPKDSLPVATGDTLQVQWAPPVRGTVSYGISDLVRLSNNPYAQDSSTVPMDVHVTLHITATKNPDHGNYLKSLDSDTLMVVELWVGMRGADLYPAGLDSALATVNEAMLAFTGAHALLVNLAAVEVDTGSGWQAAGALPKGLLAEFSISLAQQAIVDLNTPPDELQAQWRDCQGANTLAAAQELLLTWGLIDGMEAYDVEWTWVDDYKAQNGVPVGQLAPIQISYDLERDATRVTVPGNKNFYRIPLLYDRGWIVWRVRGSAHSPYDPSAWVHGAWTAVPAQGNVQTALGLNAQFAKQVPGHHKRKNWQASSSFAEDGRHKEVVTYADGTSRARQVVTRGNTLGAPIVGETVYDATGRAALQIMPVPVMNDGCVEIMQEGWGPIEYRPNFNQEDSLTGAEALTWADLLGGCMLSAPPLDSASGAQYYYSGAYATEAGPVLEPAPSFIPRAEGKPYSHTEYTRDNTGRVRAQGGVGPEFQPGMHDTRNFYGTPGQIELDRLFGPEAGHWQHYRKNVTIDPNDQATVTYLDMAGRTVATALACDSPDGMDPVGVGGVELTEDLFGGVPSTTPDLQLHEDGPSLVFRKQFVVPCTDEYTFDYRLVPLFLSDNCWNNYCAQCVYDLSITLADDCGVEVFSHEAIVGSLQIGQDGAVNFLTDCTVQDPAVNTWTETRPLSEGEYTLTKRLRVHAPAREQYVADLLLPANNTCARDSAFFHDQVYAAIDYSGCDVDCDACYAAIGSLEHFIQDLHGTADQYAILLQQCDDLCKPDSWCQAAYKTMLADVSWNGQYGKTGQVLVGSEMQYVAPDFLSVFHDDPATGVLRRNFSSNPTGEAWRSIDQAVELWRQPLMEGAAGWEAGYRDLSGIRTMIPVALDDLGNYHPEVQNPLNDVFEVDGELYTWPEDLLHLNDFIHNWRDGWERSLVRFHPEYCYYRDCKAYGVQQDPNDRFSSSDGFDARLLTTETHAAAVANGLLAGNGQFQYMDDPFIMAGDGYADALVDRVQHYVTVNGNPYSMMEMAVSLAHCNGTFGPGCTTIPAISDPAVVKDAWWTTLQGLYTSEKYRLQKQRADDFVRNCDCPGMNVCIGESSTSSWWSRMHTPISYGSWNPWTSSQSWSDYVNQYWSDYYAQPGNLFCQPCYNESYAHYTNRVRRVPDPDLIGGPASTMDAAYETYLTTGQCPVGTAWLSLFQQLFTSTPFEPNGTYNLEDQSAWQGIYIALNDLEPGVAAPAAQAIFGTQGNVLTMTVHYTDGTPDCVITLTGPAGIDWQAIVFAVRIEAGAAQGDFSLGVYLSTQNGGADVTWLQGTGMCHALAPCNFPPTCTPNELALQFQDLMSLMAVLGHLDGSVGLNSVHVPPGSAGDPLVQSTLGAAITSRFGPNMQLGWKYDLSNPANPRLLLIDANTGGNCQYILDNLSVADATPPNLTLGQCLAQAVFFQNITSDNANRFIVDVYGPNGLLCRLQGKAWFQCNGPPQPLPFGSCELPPPLSCQGGQYTLLTDLVSVLNDWVPAYQGQYAGTSLWESTYMTTSLALAICPDCNADWEALHATAEGGGISVAGCLQLTFDYPGNPVPFFSLGEAVLSGTPEGDGAWHDVKIPLLAGDGTQVGQLTVETCLDLYPCEPCPELPDTLPGGDPEDPEEPQGLRVWANLPDSTLRALGMVHADTLWAGYLEYSQAVDSLDQRLGLAAADSGFVAAMDYPAYRKLGMQHAVGAYLRYIRNFRPEIDRSILLHKSAAFVAEKGNTVNVDEEYKRYVSAVEDYNTRAAAQGKPAVEQMADTIFRELLLADKVKDYIANLVEMPPLEDPPLGLEDYLALSGDSTPTDACALLYTGTYLPAYKQFEAQNQDSTARCPEYKKYAPLVSLEEFRASNLCCNDSGQAVLARYLLQLVNNTQKCPGALPRLKECPAPLQKAMMADEQECQRLYALWEQALLDYKNSPFAIMSNYALYPVPFEEFLDQGWCECVETYLRYLQVYTAWEEGQPKPPLPMHIADFCKRDCRKSHEEWRELMGKYNEPCLYVDTTGHYLPIGQLDDQGYFESEGLCDCVEAYIVYIGIYVDWSPGMTMPPAPMTIQTFCAQQPEGPDCCVLTDSLKVTILEYYPSSEYYANYPYPLTFEWKGCEEMEERGLCDCLPDYLAYLAQYVNWHPVNGPAPPAPLELVDFCNSVGTTDPCADSYARYYNGLIALKPLLNQVSPELDFDWADEAYFTSAGLCYCVDAYLAYAEQVLAQALSLSPPSLVPFTGQKGVPSIFRFCEPPPEPCPPLPLPNIPPTIPMPVPDPCPCCTALEVAADIEVQRLYEHFTDSLTADITARYNSTCMTALESLTMNFVNSEHHYTLYYYDQAGNLVRTVPPAGVEPLPITAPTDALELAIVADRANGTRTVFTEHRLASDHLYNSLGQPTRTAMPDQDNMDLWETALTTGLPDQLRITGSWFGTGGAGYLTGWKDMGTASARGYAYRTADGGKSWQRLTGLLGEDLTDVHFPTSTVGFATGGHGSLVRTLDGGSSWDLLTNSLLGEGKDLSAVMFATDQQGVVLGNNYSSFTGNQGTAFGAGTAVAGGPAFSGAGHDGTSYQATASAFEGYANGAVLSAPQGGPWSATGAFGSLDADLTCTASFPNGATTTVRAGGSRGVLIENNAPAADDWRMLPTGTADKFLAIAFLDAQNGVAIMDSTGIGVLRHTVDGGQSWVPIGLPEFDLAALAEAERTATTLGLVAVGKAGTVVRVLLVAGTDPHAGIIPMGGVPESLDLTAVWAQRSGTNLYAIAGTANGKVLATVQLGLGQQASWTAAYQLNGTPARVKALAAQVLPGAIVPAVALKANGVRGHVRWNFGGGTLFQQQGGSIGQATVLSPVLAAKVDVYNAADGSIRRVTLGTGGTFAEVALTVTGTGPAQAPAALQAAPGGLWSAGPGGELFGATASGTTYAWGDRSDRIRPLPLRAMDKGGEVAVGDQGLIYHRTPGGWRSTPTGRTATLRAVAVASGGTAVAAGDGGTAFSFATGSPGSTTALAVPVVADLHAAAFDGSKLTLGGDAGLLLYSPQIGTVPLAALPPANCGGIRALAATGPTVVAVGDGSLVQQVAGTVRMPVPDVFTPKLNAVDFAGGGLDGYVVGDAQTARHTTDGGQHWRTVPMPALSAAPDKALNAVKATGPGAAMAVGSNGLAADFTGLAWSASPLSAPGDELTAVAIAASGAAVVTGADNYKYYTRNQGATTWTAHTAGVSLYTVWNFPRIQGKDEFIIGGETGYSRLLPFPGGVFTAPSPVVPNVTGNAPIRAFWFHDHISGLAVCDNGLVYRTDPIATQVNHSNFVWGNAQHMDDGLDGQAQTGMLPATIGFSDRHQGFIGGSYNGTPVRYARTITDESGLYGQRFWYDALGRIVLSQNTKQFNANPQRFSYSLYDALGRVYEAGELDDDDPNALFRTHVPGMLVGGQFKPDVIDPGVLKAWVQGRTRREVTRTFYDAPMPGLNVPGFTQDNLRLRVASTTFREAAATGLAMNYDHATHYSYDIHGNVKELVQDLPQLGTDGGSCTGCVDHRYKKLRYTYDLISGNVLRVDYGTGDDQMHHRYSYDADNRITEVETSADAVVWHRDAEYFYYPHGPLQRVELGEHKVQGMDYAYTLQGWLKGINSDRLTPETDMGQDGLAGTANEFVGRDAYGESIGYFGDADYKAIDASRWGGSPERPFAALGDPQTATGTLHDAYNPLYNGNIAHTVNSLQPWGGWTSPTQPAQVLAQVYKYDQLNRLKQAQGVEGLTSANTWDGITDAVADRYKSQYTYDANGNIETVARFDETGTQYDNLQYHYEKNGAQLLRNRLYHLNETIDGGYGDIGIDASTFHAAHADVNALNNYKYDELGNLIADKREEIANIEWTVSGKVKHITRTAGSTKPELWFTYGADGQRTSKTVGDPLNGGFREWYLRDAQGNIMAMYKYADNGTSLKVTERPVYGSSRLGSYVRQMELVGEPAVHQWPYTQPMQAPLKRYELTDHLGNVNTVVTGRLLPMLGLGVQYQAEVVSAQTQEPYGALLPNRNWNSATYKFGFNGQLKDNEVYGAEGTSYTAEFWQYDPRTGRRWNLDPVPQIGISDYAAFGLNPITNIDPNGAYFFGLIGSTSEQRKSADGFAAKNNGEVINRTKKNIGVSFLAERGTGKDGVPYGIQELQQFNKDGSSIPLEGTIAEDKPGVMDEWSESGNFVGQTTYQIVDASYTLLQANPIGRMVSGSNVHHLNGSVANNNEVVDGSMAALPIPGAGLFAGALRSTAAKGLVTPAKYFGSKTASELSTIMTRKFGPSRSIREGAETFFNSRTRRSFNLHTDPAHGAPHIDIRTRGGYPELKYPLKGE